MSSLTILEKILQAAQLPPPAQQLPPPAQQLPFLSDSHRTENARAVALAQHCCTRSIIQCIARDILPACLASIDQRQSHHFPSPHHGQSKKKQGQLPLKRNLVLNEQAFLLALLCLEHMVEGGDRYTMHWRTTGISSWLLRHANKVGTFDS